MGKRNSRGICGVMGCPLPNLHAGMHETVLLCKTRRTDSVVCSVVNEGTANITSSPCNERNDTVIRHSEIELELLKDRLRVLKKQVNDICETLNL